MGKSIANGHPMAAVVTRREIAEAFDNGITYFNTFGGNPVSCAIGLACLNVLEQENLMANTKAMSSLLLKGLNELQSRHSLIGDIRGLGLYIGVELVTDRLERTPATSAAKRIVELMKIKGVLVNTNGYDSNVIKIKPPMIIDAADIDQLLSAFESALCEVEKSL
jgi:4-aminobutyrate aminotransferase-like enzyme